MLTKGDLGAIQKMFDSLRNEMNERFVNVDQKFVNMGQKFVTVDERFAGVNESFASVDKRFVNLDNKIDRFSNLLQKNTDELVELITIGFNAQDAGFNRIEKVLVNHEKRIGSLEKTIFKTN